MPPMPQKKKVAIFLIFLYSKYCLRYSLDDSNLNVKGRMRKMKKFLFAFILLYANVLIAQGLFPELAGLGDREKKVNPVQDEPVAQAVVDNDVPDVLLDDGVELDDDTERVKMDADELDEASKGADDEVDLFQVKDKKVEEQVVETASDEKDEQGGEDDPKIVIYTSSTEVVIPPNKNFAYCFGDLKFASTLNRPVQALDVVIAYGPFVSTYQIRDLVKGKEQSDSFGLAGDACELITGMPQMEIKRCVVEGMTEDVCKKKVVFLPLTD